MIVVTGTFRFPADVHDRVTAEISKVEAATRDEVGCLVYTFYADRDDPDRFRVYEEWASWGALEAHGATPHISAFREALEEIGVLEREVKAMEVGEIRRL